MSKFSRAYALIYFFRALTFFHGRPRYRPLARAQKALTIALKLWKWYDRTESNLLEYFARCTSLVQFDWAAGMHVALWQYMKNRNLEGVHTTTVLTKFDQSSYFDFKLQNLVIENLAERRVEWMLSAVFSKVKCRLWSFWNFTSNPTELAWNWSSAKCHD